MKDKKTPVRLPVQVIHSIAETTCLPVPARQTGHLLGLQMPYPNTEEWFQLLVISAQRNRR